MTAPRWFALRVAGAILGPFALMTAFMAFGPRALGAYPFTIVCLSIAVGLAAWCPQRITAAAVGMGVLYFYTMLVALQWWTLVAAGFWFPAAWRALHINV